MPAMPCRDKSAQHLQDPGSPAAPGAEEFKSWCIQHHRVWYPTALSLDLCLLGLIWGSRAERVGDFMLHGVTKHMVCIFLGGKDITNPRVDQTLRSSSL